MVPSGDRGQSTHHGGFGIGIVEGTTITDDIVDTDANRECDTSIDRFAVYFFRVLLGSGGFHHGCSEFAQVQNLSSDNGLCNKSF